MNTMLRQIPKVYEHKSEVLKRKIRELFLATKNEQEKAYPDIIMLTKKEEDSFLRTLQCKNAGEILAKEFRNKGVDVQGINKSKTEEKRRRLDPTMLNLTAPCEIMNHYLLIKLHWKHFSFRFQYNY